MPTLSCAVPDCSGTPTKMLPVCPKCADRAYRVHRGPLTTLEVQDLIALATVPGTKRSSRYWLRAASDGEYGWVVVDLDTGAAVELGGSEVVYLHAADAVAAMQYAAQHGGQLPPGDAPWSLSGDEAGPEAGDDCGSDAVVERERCPSCDASGLETCDRCRGEGLEHAGAHDCSECAGDGMVECHDCDGTGGPVWVEVLGDGTVGRVAPSAGTAADIWLEDDEQAKPAAGPVVAVDWGLGPAVTVELPVDQPVEASARTTALDALERIEKALGLVPGDQTDEEVVAAVHDILHPLTSLYDEALAAQKINEAVEAADETWPARIAVIRVTLGSLQASRVRLEETLANVRRAFDRIVPDDGPLLDRLNKLVDDQLKLGPEVNRLAQENRALRDRVEELADELFLAQSTAVLTPEQVEERYTALVRARTWMSIATHGSMIAKIDARKADEASRG